MVDAWVWNAEGRPGLCTTAFQGHENKMPQEWTARFFQDKALRSGGPTRHLWDRGPIQCLSRRVAPTWCRRSSIGVHRIQESLSPGMHVIGAHD